MSIILYDSTITYMGDGTGELGQIITFLIVPLFLLQGVNKDFIIIINHVHFQKF